MDATPMRQKRVGAKKKPAAKRASDVFTDRGSRQPTIMRPTKVDAEERDDADHDADQS
jgi:hypothetical protein